MNLSGFQQIHLTKDSFNLIAFKVVGKITTDDMHYFNMKLDQLNNAGKKALVYFDLTNYEGFELGVIFEKLSNFDSIWIGISRCAYIIDGDLLSNLIGLVDVVTPINLKAFNQSQTKEAEAWLFEEEIEKAPA